MIWKEKKSGEKLKLSFKDKIKEKNKKIDRLWKKNCKSNWDSQIFPYLLFFGFYYFLMIFQIKKYDFGNFVK